MNEEGGDELPFFEGNISMEKLSQREKIPIFLLNDI